MSIFTRFFKPNPDAIAGFLALWMIIAYVFAYGLLHIGGIVWDDFGLGYLIVLLPVWLIDGLKTSFEAMMPRQYKTADEDLSKVTVVIACKDGEAVIGATLTSLKRKFAPSQIIVASNGSTDRTCQIARSHGAMCLEYPEPLGKVRAINAALSHVTTPYVLLLDDDTLVGTAEIPTGLLDAGYDAVAFRVLVKYSTWVSRLQSHEYRKSSDIGRRYHNKGASVQNVSGAIGLFRTRVLEQQIGRHTGEFSGEDLQRTLLVYLTAGKRTPAKRGGVVLARSIVFTQAPSTIRQLFRQRVFGWFPGLYANFFNYVRILGRRRSSFALRLDALYNSFFVITLDVLRVLTLPIMFFYPWYFVVTYISYMLLELIPYVRSGRVDPLWVILVYPLYGIFGLLTRVCAGAVFFYRRLASIFSKQEYFDDYRQAPAKFKYASVGVVAVGLGVALATNISSNYMTIVTALQFAR